jgi:pyridoxal phosphate enzyme (YggS family)
VDNSRIAEAVAAGVLDLGENRVQELIEKKEAVGQGVRWHLIGHLQTNKVKYIIGFVHLIHSLDSLHLAEEIEKQAERLERLHGRARTVDVLVQVNTSSEETKFGIAPDAAVQFVQQVAPLAHIRIHGLMTIGAFLPNPEDVRPCFRLLRKVRDDIQREMPTLHLPHLSMGMTHDFEVAIEEGATIIRVGTAIFGARG